MVVRSSFLEARRKFYSNIFEEDEETSKEDSQGTSAYKIIDVTKNFFLQSKRNILKRESRPHSPTVQHIPELVTFSEEISPFEVPLTTSFSSLARPVARVQPRPAACAHPIPSRSEHGVQAIVLGTDATTQLSLRDERPEMCDIGTQRGEEAARIAQSTGSEVATQHTPAPSIPPVPPPPPLPPKIKKTHVMTQCTARAISTDASIDASARHVPERHMAACEDLRGYLLRNQNLHILDAPSAFTVARAKDEQRWMALEDLHGTHIRHLNSDRFPRNIRQLNAFLCSSEAQSNKLTRELCLECDQIVAYANQRAQNASENIKDLTTENDTLRSRIAELKNELATTTAALASLGESRQHEFDLITQECDRRVEEIQRICTARALEAWDGAERLLSASSGVCMDAEHWRAALLRDGFGMNRIRKLVLALTTTPSIELRQLCEESITSLLEMNGSDSAPQEVLYERVATELLRHAHGAISAEDMERVLDAQRDQIFNGWRRLHPPAGQPYSEREIVLVQKVQSWARRKFEQKRLDRVKKSRMLVCELRDTQRSFANIMDSFVNRLLVPLSQVPAFGDADKLPITALREIVAAAWTLVDALSESLTRWNISSCVAPALNAYSASFEQYREYIDLHQWLSMVLVDQPPTETQKLIDSFVGATGQPLESVLIRPCQILPRVILFIRELSKETARASFEGSTHRHTQYETTLQLFQEGTADIDESKYRAESRFQLERIRSHVHGFPSGLDESLLVDHRKLPLSIMTFGATTQWRRLPADHSFWHPVASEAKPSKHTVILLEQQLYVIKKRGIGSIARTSVVAELSSAELLLVRPGPEDPQNFLQLIGNGRILLLQFSDRPTAENYAHLIDGVLVKNRLARDG
eukprot:gnl/Chilomastix_cuspidata/5669.p1 GENE.gnl/Chilomastix_cuspidata/5669~~gnl/Chilomastix_cuspidata/5669.p1  ORF type:complete len:929 (-),score=52.01 gnl/Chilomastix_cuspidata/5669:161-2782(-)